jgi:hypothetical protein
MEISSAEPLDLPLHQLPPDLFAFLNNNLLILEWELALAHLPLTWKSLGLEKEQALPILLQ